MNQSANRLLIGVFSLWASAACNDQPTEPGPAELVIIQAPSTVGAPGWELIDTLIVRAVDPSGSPRAGVGVTWTVRQGGGSIAPTAEATDADGYAKAVWTLGATSGVNQVRVSTLEGSQVDFESTGEAFRVDRLAAGCGLSSGAVWCWANVAFSAQVPSHYPLFGHWDSGPTLLDDTHQYVEIAMAGSSVCALTEQSQVWCANADYPEMNQVTGVPAMHNIVGGGYAQRYCGVADSDSTIWCWRVGGMPEHLFVAEPFRTVGMADANVFCGLRADSTAACWGEGDGAPATPVAVNGNHRFTELAIAQGYACGLEPDGDVWCWLTRFNDPVPLDPVYSTSGAFHIASEWYGMQAILAGGAMIRWKGPGYLGVQTMHGLEGKPVVEFANNALICVRLVDGQVYCYEDMWNNSSAIYDDVYSPVQPLRSDLLGSAQR